MITWRERVQLLRRTMTLREIAEQIGMSPSSVSDLEQGRHESPRGDAALRLDALYWLRAAPSEVLKGSDQLPVDKFREVST
jgi:transcriptional regulator with XRE-family HTH domain